MTRLAALLVVACATLGCYERCDATGVAGGTLCRDGDRCSFRLAGSSARFECASCGDCRVAADAVAGFIGDAPWSIPPETAPFHEARSGLYLFNNFRVEAPDECELNLPTATFTKLDVVIDYNTGAISLGSAAVPGFADQSAPSFGSGHFSDPTHATTELTVTEHPDYDGACTVVLQRTTQITVHSHSQLSVRYQHRQSQGSGRCAVPKDCTSRFSFDLY